MTVRSARLASGIVGPASTLQTVYTTPAGVTTIIKDIRASRGVSGAVFITIGLLSGAQFIGLINRQIDTTENLVALQPWCTLEPGDRIAVQSATAGGFTFFISGTELRGVAP
jgi:hypothetical protein